MSEEGFAVNDLVFHEKNGKVAAGGYVINSQILQKGGAAIKNLNVSNSNGLQKMAVPAGLFLIHQNKEINDNLNMDNHVSEIGGTVNDGVFDNLFKMLGGRKKKKKRKTRRSKKRSKIKTRKKR